MINPPTDVPGSFTVRVLSDPVVERHGFAVRDVYAEALWLPVVGPSALWALRRLVALAETSPDGCRVQVPELAASLGLGTSTGRHAPIVRTLNRLVQFELASWHGDELLVRRAVAPLTQRHLRKLPPALQRLHATMAEGRNVPTARVG